MSKGRLGRLESVLEKGEGKRSLPPVRSYDRTLTSCPPDARQGARQGVSPLSGMLRKHVRLKHSGCDEPRLF